MWTSVPKIRVSVSMAVARTHRGHSSAFALMGSLDRPSVPSASTWTSVPRQECVPTANALTWTDLSNASAIPDTNFLPMAKTALVF